MMTILVILAVGTAGRFALTWLSRQTTHWGHRAKIGVFFVALAATYLGAMLLTYLLW